MKRYLLNLTIAMFGMALVLMACSDKKATENNLVEGDYQAEDFQLARQDADSSVSEMNADDAEVGAWLRWNPGMVAVDSVTYDSLSGWHVRAAFYNGDYFMFAVTDSFRLTDLLSHYQFRRDSTTNIFERRLKKSYTLTPQPESMTTYWTKERSRNANWVGLADTVTVLNGDFRRYWHGQREARIFERLVTGQMSDISFRTTDLFDGWPTHPFAGTFTGQMTLDIDKPQRQIHLEGTLTVTFFPDHYHVRLVRGNNWWEWDHYYNP